MHSPDAEDGVILLIKKNIHNRSFLRHHIWARPVVDNILPLSGSPSDEFRAVLNPLAFILGPLLISIIISTLLLYETDGLAPLITAIRWL